MGTERKGSGKPAGREGAGAADAKTMVLGKEHVPAVTEANTRRLTPDEPVDARVVRDKELPHTVASPGNTVESAAPGLEDQGEIAQGGMGSVHRVFDHAILRTVVQKRLHDMVRSVPGAAARFLEEAQITGQLDHPNIVPEGV